MLDGSGDEIGEPKQGLVVGTEVPVAEPRSEGGLMACGYEGLAVQGFNMGWALLEDKAIHSGAAEQLEEPREYRYPSGFLAAMRDRFGVDDDRRLIQRGDESHVPAPGRASCFAPMKTPLSWFEQIVQQTCDPICFLVEDEHSGYEVARQISPIRLVEMIRLLPARSRVNSRSL